jgi:hypothetical protein
MSSITHEDDEDTKYLEHEPSIRCHAGIVFEQFSLCARYISAPSAVSGYVQKRISSRSDIRRIGVYTLNRLPLLRHHISQLREDGPQLGDRRLDRLDSSRPGLDVIVLPSAVLPITGLSGSPAARPAASADILHLDPARSPLDHHPDPTPRSLSSPGRPVGRGLCLFYLQTGSLFPVLRLRAAARRVTSLALVSLAARCGCAGFTHCSTGAGRTSWPWYA